MHAPKDGHALGFRTACCFCLSVFCCVLCVCNYWTVQKKRLFTHDRDVQYQVGCHEHSIEIWGLPKANCGQFSSVPILRITLN